MRVLGFFLAVTSATVLLARCGALNGEDDKNKATTAGGSCAVVASASSVSKGASVDLRIKDGFDWTGVQSVTVDDKVLSASSPKTTVTVSSTRTYVAVVTKSDGSQSSCSVEVAVDGETGKQLSCTLSANPTEVPAEGGAVAVSLAVVGEGGATKTSINGQDLGSAVGGSKSFTIAKSTTFVGKVEKGELVGSCSVDVSVSGATETGACKERPDSADLAVVNQKNKELEAENTAARNAAKAKALTDHALTELTGLTPKKTQQLYKSNLDQTELCQAINTAIGTAQTKCVLSASPVKESDFGAYHVELDQGRVVVFVYQESPLRHYTAAKAANGDPAVIVLSENVTVAVEVPFAECECDSFADDAKDSAGIAAPPAHTILIAPLGGNAYPTMAAKAHVQASFVEKIASFKYKRVAPPAGTPKPKCQLPPEAAT